MRFWDTLVFAGLLCAVTGCSREPTGATTSNGDDPPRPPQTAVNKAAQAAEERFGKYRDQLEQSINGIDEKIESLARKAGDAATETKADVYEQLAALYRQQTEVHKQMKELRRQGADKFQEVKQNLEQTLSEMQNSLKTAQAKIDEAVENNKISAAANKSRQEYEQFQAHVEKTVESLDQQIYKLLSRANEAAKETRAEIYEQAATLYQKREDVGKRLSQLRSAGIEGWQEMRAGVDQAVQNFGDAVNRAVDKFKDETAKAAGK